MDRLDQLFARSKREIEAHTAGVGDTDTGRYFIDNAAKLLAALRLWVQIRVPLVAALLREARSVSRRADKLGADIAAMQDPTIQELAAQASSSIDQLVHQLMRLDQQAQRTRRAAGHRAR